MLLTRKKFTKYEHYLNSPKNEEMKATEVTPYTVPLVEYKDEVGTSSTVNGIILGVQQTSKSLCRIFLSETNCLHHHN